MLYAEGGGQVGVSGEITWRDEADDLDDKDRKRLNYFASQIVDMMSPTNFLGTNPDALERAPEAVAAEVTAASTARGDDVARDSGS